LGKVGKGQGVWAKCPSSTSPPSRSRQGHGLTVAGRWRGGSPPATRCAATAGRWGKTKRSLRAIDSASYLGRGQPVEAAPLRWAAAGDGGWGGGARGLGKQGETAVAVQGRVRHCPPLFMGVGKAVRGDILSFAELQWPAMEVQEKSRRGLRPAGFSVDLVLCELTCRAGAGVAAEGRPSGSNGGRFGGDGSLLVFVCQGREGRRGSVGRCRRRGAGLACCPARQSA
jgi:hypothetical protein